MAESYCWAEMRAFRFVTLCFGFDFELDLNRRWFELGFPLDCVCLGASETGMVRGCTGRGMQPVGAAGSWFDRGPFAVSGCGRSA